MAEKNSNQTEFAIQFLMSEHETAVAEIWKDLEHSWEVFKFYITLITGSAGFVLALLSLNLNNYSQTLTVLVSSTIIFIIGLTVHMQLVGTDIKYRRVKNRLVLIRNKISNTLKLKSYFEMLKEANAELVNSPTYLGYSLREQTLRALRVAGIKTQLVLLNSLVGTVALVATGVLAGVQKLHYLFYLGIGGFIILLLLHSLIAKIRSIE